MELRPHAFRSIAATSIATEDPEHVSIIADVLRHLDLGGCRRSTTTARTG